MRKGILLLAACAAGMLTWAQSGDTPIIIADGSLFVDSAVPWSQYTGSGDIKAHPQTGKFVTKVAVAIPGNNQTIDYSRQACTVDITYDNAHIVFSTGGNGQGFSMRPFGVFRTVAGNPNRIVHQNGALKISHVKITKAGSTVVDTDTNGGTKITISYQ